MDPKPSINLWGTLDLLVLRAIDVDGPVHGLGVMDAIERSSHGSIEVEDGALYRCLHRLEKRKLLSAEWRMSKKNRRAKFYALTPSGRAELAKALTEWERQTRAFAGVLGLELEILP